MNTLADTKIANGSDPFYPVVIDDGVRRKLWQNCATLAEAEVIAATLRRHGFDAKIIVVGATE